MSYQPYLMSVPGYPASAGLAGLVESGGGGDAWPGDGGGGGGCEVVVLGGWSVAVTLRMEQSRRRG